MDVYFGYFGHVDAYGGVHGKRRTEAGETHTTAQLMSGKTWRWAPHEGFQNFRPWADSKLTPDDYHAIVNWLLKQGEDPDHWSFTDANREP